jgi:hypothetical protein
MEATHHNEISKIGEGVLKSALAKGNPDRKLRLGAFYLGNWLTDVSQAVDPVAYKGFSDGKLEDMNAFFHKLIYDAPSWIKGRLDSLELLESLRGRLDKAREQAIKHVKDALEAGRSGQIAEGARESFRFIGYGKFVAPDQEGGEPRMDPDAYKHVFDRLFIQYYPYMHLDRPALSTDVYDARVASKPRNKHVEPGPACQGDLYEYLRDNIQIAASRFAYLDAGRRGGDPHLSWAAGTFNPVRAEFEDEQGNLCAVDDRDLSWNYHLALLGHGLHAIEDFFAHSTFAEHASVALPDAYNKVQRRLSDEVLARRLKQWRRDYSEERWQDLPDDPNVVTGYFDSTDTMFSLSHLVEEKLGWNREGVGKKIDGVREYDYQRLLQDTLEFVTDPKEILAKTDPEAPDYDEDKANRAAKWLREKYSDVIGKDVEKMTKGDPKAMHYVESILDSPHLPKDTPPWVKKSFREAVRLFGAYKDGKNLYSTLKELYELVTTPWRFVFKFLGKTILKALVDQLQAYLADAAERRQGGRRIGCHSLIAKDGGPELFYKAGMACAGAAHWYVVATLARHARRHSVDVSRTAEAMCHANSIYRSPWIDWLELVEYYLGHPLSRLEVKQQVREIESTILHITRPGGGGMSSDSLKSLADEYRPTAVRLDPRTGELEKLGEAFTWETIADANFPTAGLSTEERKRKINDVLSHQPDRAARVHDKVNWAFRPGYELVIPHQTTRLSEAKSEVVQRTWWYPVVTQAERDSSVLQSWYDEDGALTAAAPQYAHIPVPLPRSEVLELVEDSDALRKRLEAEYK